MVDNSDHTRMGFRRADDTTGPMHAKWRQVFMELDDEIKLFANRYNLDGRSVALVHTNLDQALMWMNRAIALKNDLDPEPELPTKLYRS